MAINFKSNYKRINPTITLDINSSNVSDFNEAAQDAVGNILVDGTTINFTYSDITPSITAEVQNLDSTDISDFTEAAQDAIGAMVDSSLSYTDGGPTLGININNSNTWTALQTFDSGLLVKGLQAVYVTKSANYTLGHSDVVVHFTAGPYDARLPSAVGISGQVYIIKNTSGATITVYPDGVETIDGAVSYSLLAGNCAWLLSTNSNWILI